MNPYDFVRLPEQVIRERASLHEKFRGRNGAFRCRLAAITPLFIPRTQSSGGTLEFITSYYDGRDLPFIPGSSLKGVIRSVAEAVSASCISLSGTLFHKGRVADSYRGKIDPSFLTCKERARMCPACRIFGMVSKKDRFLGKVSFSDARTEVDRFRRGSRIILEPLMGPKPTHSAFYLPNGEVAGRKFYFHHAGALNTTSRPTERTKTVIPLEGLDAHRNPQTVFEFDVTFSNLTEDEYALLVFALTLTDEMRHKLGSGKPHGLGTVKIEIVELREHTPNLRYSGLGARQGEAPPGIHLTGEALQAHLRAQTSVYTATPTPSLQDLQRIWKYPAATDSRGNPVQYRYPDQTWFNDNPGEPISNTP